MHPTTTDLSGYGGFLTVAQVAAALRANPHPCGTIGERVRAMAKAGQVSTLSMTLETMFSQPAPEPGAAVRELIPHPVEDEYGPLEVVDLEALR